MKRICNEGTDSIRIAAYNVERLTEVDAFNHVVDNEGLGDETKQGEKCCFHIKHKESGQCDKKVAQQECTPDINACVFAQNHCHDIRAAA